MIAYGRAGDALVALSTSGGSVNVIAALNEARRREMVTVALVGYDGGRIAAEGLADHVVLAPSQNIPRIQEAQASAYHIMRELIERCGWRVLDLCSGADRCAAGTIAARCRDGESAIPAPPG